jgi:PBSX family phage portal protein
MADQHISIVKARTIGEMTSNALSGFESEDSLFTGTGAITPPYDPETLINIFEHSNSLRQNADAFATNIDSFGHRYEPVLDLEAEDVMDTIRVSLLLDSGGKVPTDEEVEVRIDELKSEMDIEKAKIKAWFDSCCVDISFVELRRRTRLDLEVTGNAYWEILRNASGEIVEFVGIPSFTVRLMPIDTEYTPYVYRQRTPTYGIEEVTKQKRFRRFVQMYSGAPAIYFKEFGDTRVISSRTGIVYDDLAAMQKEEENAVPATEMLHYRVYSPRSSYGIPRWIGVLLSILGSRSAEEVNYLYFDNKSIPPLAVLVSGGALSDNAVERIERYVNDELKGKRNFHKILVIDAEGAGAGTAFETAGKTRIEIVPLHQVQTTDAQFQIYDERNIDKVGMAFRIPRLLRGDTRDFNRATAQSALEFAESQVFAPERNEFDFTINKRVLLELGFQYWLLRSNTPVKANPQEAAAILKNLENILPVGTAAKLSEDIFGKNFPDIKSDWGKRPLKLTLAALERNSIQLDDYTQAPTEELEESEEEPVEELDEVTTPEEPVEVAEAEKGTDYDLFEEARRLIALRKELLSTADESARDLLCDDTSGTL